MMEFLKKIVGKEQSKVVLKDRITYLILSDRKNLYRR